MNKKEYQRAFRARKPQVCVTMPLSEWQQYQRDAEKHNLTIGQLLLQESRHYRQGEFLSDNVINGKLDSLTLSIRGIANNINQLSKHSNRFKKLINERRILQLLQQLEQDINHKVKSSWSPSKDDSQ